MNFNECCPILVIPAVPLKTGGIRFFHLKEQLDIPAEEAELVWMILRECNGYNTLTDIAMLTGINTKIVKEVILELTQATIIEDSRKQYLHFHRISNYPTNFNWSMTQEEIENLRFSARATINQGDEFAFNKISSYLETIMLKRRSCRDFTKQKLDLELIGNICYYGYSISKHHVPSGGALYPLKLYVIATTQQNDFSAGYYEYDPEKNILVLFSKEIDIEQLKFCFNSEEIGFGAPIQIIIAGDLARQTNKYTNRGYRLTLLEAGHVAENISLFCAEHNLGTCELGGILDEPMRFELNMRDEIYPILGISIGYPSLTIKNRINEKDFLEKHRKEWGIDQLYFGTDYFNDEASFFGATAAYGEQGDCVAGATSASLVHAEFKANIEAYERKKSGEARIDFEGSANDLEKKNKKWIGPSKLVPLTKEQIEKCGFLSFRKDLSIQWTVGYSYKDSIDLYIPTDIVYYGHNLGKNIIYSSNSSGVAAHIDLKKAEIYAITELLERDAIMRSWYQKESPQILSEDALSVHAHKRLRYWNKKNRSVTFLYIPSQYARVVLVTITSNEYPCFVCGAAATMSNSVIEYEQILNKALQEAEYCLYSCLKHPNYQRIELEKVQSPMEHGRVYHFRDFIDSLSWLWMGTEVKHIPQFSEKRISDISSELELIKVIMTDEDDSVQVVRMLSAKLIPISFGYNCSHYTHPSINKEIGTESLSLPHFFA